MPEFRKFQVSSSLKAAKLTNDPARRKAYYSAALEFYGQELKRAQEATKAGDDPNKEKAIQLQMARVQYDIGDAPNLELARQIFGELIQQKLLGGPINRQDGQYNDVYWEATYKLLDCNARLLKGQELESTRGKLKELYILWDGQPGGPKWTREFDKLRKALVPGWAPATRPAGGG